MLLTEFDYELPISYIAQSPSDKRDNSKLLIYNRKTNIILHKKFHNIIEYLKSDDVLVINNTKVSKSRINFNVANSKKIFEILLVDKIKDNNVFDCIVYPGKKFKIDKEFIINNKLKVKVMSKSEIGRLLKFESLENNKNIENIINEIASIPLPPYITEYKGDINRYQTVFAKEEGSTAAPTASLHWTKELFEKVKNKVTDILEVNLKVGPGTFQPVKTQNIEEHKIHFEYYKIEEQVYKKLLNYKKQNKRIVAVGTTSVRTLETVFQQNQNIKLNGKTNLFIYPGYKFKIVDAMITNFHLPKSSLLMLVSAFIGGEQWKKIYKTAIENDYRFFSFGDAMFIE